MTGIGPAEQVRQMINEAVEKAVAEAIKDNGEVSPEQRAEIEKQVLADHEADKLENQARIRGKQNRQDWVPGKKGGMVKEVPYFTPELQRQRQQQAIERRKSIDAQTSIPGSPVSAPEDGLWQDEFEIPFFSMYARMISLPRGSTFKTSKVFGYSVENRTSEKTDRSSYNGDLSSVTHTLRNYESDFRFTTNAAGDILGLEEVVVDGMQNSIVEKIEDEFLSLVTTEINKKDGTQIVKTGTASTTSTTSNILSHLAACLRKVAAKNRRGGRWLLSLDTFEILSQARTSQGEFALRPMSSEGTLGLWNYPVHLSDSMATTKTDDDVKAIFISPDIACRLGAIESYSLTRFDQTSPGSIILLAHARVREVLLNPSALAGLVVGA